LTADNCSGRILETLNPGGVTRTLRFRSVMFVR
jgi:hypothetical protein